MRSLSPVPVFAIALWLTGPFAAGASRASQLTTKTERQALHIPSTVDGSLQKSYLVVPPNDPREPRPLLIVLHPWSSDNEGRSPTIEAEAAARGWFILAPNFRGPSNHPEGCGSRAAQQDILDAAAFVRGRFAIDHSRIYLIGYSGGGFMTLLMAGRHPQSWAAASAWAGIVDLAAWYDETSEDQIRAQLRGCFGGAPGNGDLKTQYHERSPISYLRPTLKIPIEIAHGAHDPQVAVRHALRAFDLLAPGAVLDAEREQVASGRNAPSVAGDLLMKPGILLRRAAGSFRLTIYDGGHEYYPRAGMAWLAEHQRP